jgi:hypothetical protein
MLGNDRIFEFPGLSDNPARQRTAAGANQRFLSELTESRWKCSEMTGFLNFLASRTTQQGNAPQQERFRN